KTQQDLKLERDHALAEAARLKPIVEGLSHARPDPGTRFTEEPTKRWLTPLMIGIVLLAATGGGTLVSLWPSRKPDDTAAAKVAELTAALTKSDKARQDAEAKTNQTLAALSNSEQARQAAEAKAVEAEKARQAAMVKADETDRARQIAEANAADSERARKTAEAKAADSEKARQAAEAKSAQPSPSASPEMVTDCDRLAGGVSIEQISVSSALVACNAAVSKYPDVARFSYELGRVLLAAKKNDEAKRSFEKAAVTGYVPAMLSVAEVYREGGDYADARRWWEKAAAAGETKAMVDIGISYTTGRFIPRDYAQARRWFQKALAAGSTDAKDLLDKLPSK